MKKIKAGVIYETFSRLVPLLSKRFKLKGLVCLILLFINSGLDLIGLGALIPLVSIVLKEEAIHSNRYLNSFYEFSGMESTTDFTILLCLMLLAFIVAKNLTSIYIQHYQANYSYQLQKYFTDKLYRAYYTKGFLYFKNRSSPKVFRDIQAVPNVFATNILLPLLSIVNELVVLALIVVFLLIYDAQVVGLIVLVVVPTFSLFYYATRRKAEFIAEEQHRLNPLLYRNLMESVYGYIDVQITNTQQNFFKRHAQLQKKLMKVLTWSQVLKYAPTRIIETAMFVGIISIILYGLIVYDTRADLVTLISVFAVAAYRVLPSVNRVMIGIMSLNAYKYTLNMIEREQHSEIKEPQISRQQFQTLAQALEVQHVSFSYNSSDDEVLKDVSFKVKRGEVIGFIGSSGSGKSTLMNLMLGFLEPSDGKILIDGVAMNELEIQSWRTGIGYVQQEVYLTEGTIRENVAFGIDNAEINDEQVRKALELARLSSFVETLPNGIQTKVGERGSKLSGGQRQRLGIARALYKGAKVLFFDEATSALDNDTEKEVTEAIQSLAKEDLTLIIIAHRITTLKYCDRILELKSGRLKGEVSYDELIDQTT